VLATTTPGNGIGPSPGLEHVVFCPHGVGEIPRQTGGDSTEEEPMTASRTSALVVSGGGAKGAFAVGVLKHLFFAYRGTGWFAITGGTSTGALIAPLAALMGAPDPMGLEAMDALEHFYTHVTTSDILEQQSVFELIQRQDCLYESDPLNDLLHKHLRPDWFRWLQTKESPICYVVYTNYQTGQKVVVTAKDRDMTRERFIQAMRASASVPVVMEATVIDGNVCFDGGVRDLLPFGQAIDLSAETIVPVFLDPEEFGLTHSRFRRMDKILLRTLAILVDEAGRNDFQMGNLINIGIRAKTELLEVFSGDAAAQRKIRKILNKDEFADLFGQNKRVVSIISGLRPDEPLTDDSLTFEPSKMAMWLENGRQKAEDVMTSSPFV
jgi:predicted acylesterase/phospholipase RssA